MATATTTTYSASKIKKTDIESLGQPLETVCYQQYEDLPRLLEQLAAINPSTNINTQQPANNEPMPTTKADLDNNVFFMPFRAKGKAVIGREETLLQLR